MSLARSAALPRGLGRTVLRRAGSSTRNRSWRQVGRRGYASDSGHGHQQGSEIPWMIGSAVVFFPSAAWLLGQGPTKSDHGHDSHHDKHEEKSEDDKEEQQEQDQDEPKDESQDESKDESKEESQEEEPKEGDKDKDQDEGKDEAQDDSKAESKDENKGEYEAPGANAPQQINWNSSMSKGPGEGQKGQREPSQKKGEKDAQGDFSGAKHPYIDDAEKSKKGVGVTETAKIHGTVDSRAGARGVKSTGDSADS